MTWSETNVQESPSKDSPPALPGISGAFIALGIALSLQAYFFYDLLGYSNRIAGAVGIVLGIASLGQIARIKGRPLWYAGLASWPLIGPFLGLALVWFVRGPSQEPPEEPLVQTSGRFLRASGLLLLACGGVMLLSPSGVGANLGLIGVMVGFIAIAIGTIVIRML